MQRIWMRAALALVVLALPTTAHAGKPKGKPTVSVASEASSLTRLKAVVDHTVTVVDQFIHDVKAAGDDSERLTAIGRRFQSQMQATEVEMEALQKAMDPAQRAAGEDYGRDKLGPRIEAMQAALELVQQAAEGGALTVEGAELVRRELKDIHLSWNRVALEKEFRDIEAVINILA